MDVDANSKNGKEKKNSNNVSANSPISESDGFRCSSDFPDQLDRFVLQCQFGFVLPIGVFLWTLLFLFGY